MFFNGIVDILALGESHYLCRKLGSVDVKPLRRNAENALFLNGFKSCIIFACLCNCDYVACFNKV